MAGQYNVIKDFGDLGDPSHVDYSPYWVLCIISQGTLLTYNRKTGTSFFKNLADDPVINSVPPLIISDDCLNMSVSGTKRNPAQMFNAALKQTDINYLTHIFPGDYLFAWMVNSKEKYNDLLTRIANLQPCNLADDGLKFIGRVEDIRKHLVIEPMAGHKTVNYSLSATGFNELQTYFFYDYSLASNDVQAQDLGTWLVRLGVDYNKLFTGSVDGGITADNINEIIPTLINLIIGSGPSKEGNIGTLGAGGESVTATPTLANEKAPYAYVIPATVGKLLGKSQTELGKPDNVLGYADILELIIGLQNYSSTGPEVGKLFAPDIDSNSLPNRKKTLTPLLGTFLPYVPEFTNVPLWSLLQKYLNPTINEMYATLRVNSNNVVVPTIVCRQRPLTTEAFQPPEPAQIVSAPFGAGFIPNPFTDIPINVTKFLTLPQWIIPNSMIFSIDIGRSNVSRTNFIHVYGNAALLANNVSIPQQIVINPPIHDDLDIQRSGMYPQMQTVECYVGDQIGRLPTTWMRLIADWSAGSHLLLTGTVQCAGIQSPICIGDNTLFDNTVFHIEGVTHNCGISPQDGTKFFRTTLQLTNGLRADGTVDSNGYDNFPNDLPIYAGISGSDLTSNDPGLSLEGPRTFGGLPLSAVLPDRAITTKLNDSATSDERDVY